MLRQYILNDPFHISVEIWDLVTEINCLKEKGGGFIYFPLQKEGAY